MLSRASLRCVFDRIMALCVEAKKAERAPHMLGKGADEDRTALPVAGGSSAQCRCRSFADNKNVKSAA
jgi:hypothetical protein